MLANYVESMIPFINDINKWECINKFGYNGDIDNTWEDLISEGGTLVLPASGAHLHLVSDSAEDDPDKPGVGTGIHTVRLVYLDSNYVEHYEDIDLNGVAVVETVATDIFRLQKCIAKVVGSTGAAVGTISIKNHAETLTYGTIQPTMHRMYHAVYTVPEGYKLYLTGLKGSCVKADGSAVGHAHFRVMATWSIDMKMTISAFTPVVYEGIYGAMEHQFEAPLIFPEHTVVKLQANSLAAAGNYLCSGSMEGFLVKV
jgi:hypothetical protein